jgi:hypothetical protein
VLLWQVGFEEQVFALVLAYLSKSEDSLPKELEGLEAGVDSAESGSRSES